MKPLSSMGAEEARALGGLLFDLDDTLLSHGVLTRAAYGALWALHDAGFKLVAVTGRPCGWGTVLARQWPVDGLVTENGAVHVVRQGRAIAVRDTCDEGERGARRAKLAELVARVRAGVPEATLTDDVAWRRSDVTWDIGERSVLPEASVQSILREIRAVGARASRSSVHLHATFDVDDKASGAVRFCVRELGEGSASTLVRFGFVGDSGNDGACFAAFRTTFGVSNVRASVAHLTVPPRYVASGERGAGFAEIVAQILVHR